MRTNRIEDVSQGHNVLEPEKVQVAVRHSDGSS